MNSIKFEIVKFLEEHPESSKSRIEDYMKDARGTTGDCVARRLRELVSSEVVYKTLKEWNDESYTAYSVRELLPTYHLTEEDLRQNSLL